MHGHKRKLHTVLCVCDVPALGDRACQSPGTVPASGSPAAGPEGCGSAGRFRLLGWVVSAARRWAPRVWAGVSVGGAPRREVAVSLVDAVRG